MASFPRSDPLVSTPNAPAPASRTTRLLFLVVWGLSAFWAFRSLDRGWLPHDEGTLAQTAERVLHGELPHRDFQDPYTGGLGAMNAVAFRVLGVNLLTPRLVLFAFFLVWVPTLLYVTTRFAGPVVAALATALAVVWSIPNYPAAMPSWYNLFLATFGLAAILRYVETERRVWFFVAGLAGGFSVLAKSSGLFFVAAGLLFAAYREEVLDRRDATATQSAWAFRVLGTALLVTFVALLVLLVGTRAGAVGILRFIVPLGALSAFLVVTSWMRPSGRGSGARVAGLLRVGLPFVVGVALPLAALVLVYAAAGALGDLARGLFRSPAERLAFASTPPPGLSTLWVVLPLVAVLLLDLVRRRRVRLGSAALVLLAGVLLTVLPAARASLPPMWYLLNALGPAVAVSGAGWMAMAELRGLDAGLRQRVFATLCVAGAGLLIQFPFAGPIYLFYALPAIVPAALALARPTTLVARPVLMAVTASWVLFSARWINSGELFQAGGFAYDPAAATARLTLPRAGGLRVSPQDKEEYERLVADLRELTTSPYTYATPDLPEVYFLSGLKNPTPTLFDFFDDPEGRTARILGQLDAHQVNVIVLNLRLRFSGPPPPDLLQALERRYGHAAIVGDFLVRWR